MAIEIQKQRFVHVVATVDLNANTGKILYVNPADVGIVGSEAATDADAVELVVEDTQGTELAREKAAVRRDPCDPTSGLGLVQHNLPHQAGMRRIRMLHGGSELATYEARVLPAPDPAAALSFAMAEPASPYRRLVELRNIAPEPGVTYTVMVKSEGDQHWQATSVGAERPRFELDRNQFPGARHLDVRVLQSTGFEDQLIVEERVNVENE